MKYGRHSQTHHMHWRLGVKLGKIHHIFMRDLVILDKAIIMDASALKLKILKEIESLEESKLQEVYGFLQNIIRGEKELEEWDDLNEAQQQ